MKWLLTALVAALLAVAPSAIAAVPVWGVSVVHVYPHDRNAFTEGLFYLDGFLYESTGLNGLSSLRKVELATGRVLQSRNLGRQYFGEGIAPWKDHLIQLTWQSHVGFVDDLTTFRQLSQFHYTGEGWALTQNGRQIIMSDGTPQLRFLDPATL
jgi:glutamine cyclotransferase